ncbi:helix-turn-helix domain-containing protein [Cupriavidus sp. SW-Y-13]|uniref:helix-turn-helix domain-containing protein n=1 Tax=Cupriavidus sp. SW-Y-13 TaxID=2653854 RepID=UPI001365CEB1|nr:helix-turn-helix transcriptional regulator [Cupriavidus sp. SW-Y-13]MWL87135.1 helix-turn-helix domain-containing protein [Cupriavidus sp. SW-Y-13]
MIQREERECLGKRLFDERKRAGLTQAALAAIGGVSPKTQVFYEKSERVPDASYLAAIARENFDVMYILVGERAFEPLSAEESRVVSAYRQLDARARAGVLALLSGMQPESAQRVSVKGDVGQLVEGDLQVSAPMTINMGKKRKN